MVIWDLRLPKVTDSTEFHMGRGLKYIAQSASQTGPVNSGLLGAKIYGPWPGLNSGCRGNWFKSRLKRKLQDRQYDIRDTGSIPGSERSPGEGNGSPLQDPCLENPMHRGAWWATVHGVTKSQNWSKLPSTGNKNTRKMYCPIFHYGQELLGAAWKGLDQWFSIFGSVSE